MFKRVVYSNTKELFYTNFKNYNATWVRIASFSKEAVLLRTWHRIGRCLSRRPRKAWMPALPFAFQTGSKTLCHLCVKKRACPLKPTLTRLAVTKVVVMTPTPTPLPLNQHHPHPHRTTHPHRPIPPVISDDKFGINTPSCVSVYYSVHITIQGSF